MTRSFMEVSREEARAANVLVIEKTVIMPEGCPATQKVLEERGFEVIKTPLSEFEKADGSTTCLALMFSFD